MDSKLKVYLVAAIIFLMTALGIMTDLVEKLEDASGVGRIIGEGDAEKLLKLIGGL